MDLFEIEKEYYTKKIEGQSFSEIRKELEVKGLTKEQIKAVIRSIDNRVISGELSKSNKSAGRQLIYMGLVLTTLGLFITIGTYSGFINMGDSFMLSYGPIFGGVGLIGIGMNKR